MADSSKKQLIYKDYSAVNTNGSSLNVDMTESSNLLGGEIWYNWQTATSALMRAKEITTSRHHSRFFLAWWTRWAHISDNILGEQPPRHEKNETRRKRFSDYYLQATPWQPKAFPFFDVQPILFQLLHFLRFYRYKRCNHTWWEVVSRRLRKRGVPERFFIPKKLGRFRVSKFLVWSLISLEQKQLWSPSFQCPVRHRKKERINPLQFNRTAESPPPVHPMEDRDEWIADDVLASFFRFRSPCRVNPVIAAQKPRHVHPMARCHLSGSPGCKV